MTGHICKVTNNNCNRAWFKALNPRSWKAALNRTFYLIKACVFQAWKGNGYLSKINLRIRILIQWTRGENKVQKESIQFDFRSYQLTGWASKREWKRLEKQRWWQDKTLLLNNCFSKQKIFYQVSRMCTSRFSYSSGTSVI